MGQGLSEKELRDQIVNDIIAYAKSYNMADVGTEFERCLCDASNCIHEGLYRAVFIVEKIK